MPSRVQPRTRVVPSLLPWKIPRLNHLSTPLERSSPPSNPALCWPRRVPSSLPRFASLLRPALTWTSHPLEPCSRRLGLGSDRLLCIPLGFARFENGMGFGQETLREAFISRCFVGTLCPLDWRFRLLWRLRKERCIRIPDHNVRALASLVAVSAVLA